VLYAVMLGVLLGWGIPIVPGQDDGESPLQGGMQAFVVVEDAEGNERLTEMGQVLPGQVIEYAITYENTGDQPLREVKVGGLIPERTRYLRDSATRTRWRAPLFSIDGGRSFAPEPVRYVVTLADGRKEERIATPDMYSHLRWVTRRLDPGATLRFRYRVVVEE
jgi:uncharacterized repeat protein (TIGR01451 family)